MPRSSTGGPRRFTERELKRVGVEIRDASSTILGCVECGKGWAPMLQQGGKLPRGYWKCPNGCNSPEE